MVFPGSAGAGGESGTTISLSSPAPAWVEGTIMTFANRTAGALALAACGKGQDNKPILQKERQTLDQAKQVNGLQQQNSQQQLLVLRANTNEITGLVKIGAFDPPTEGVFILFD